jgi:site-specific DNA recombinase
MARRACLYVRVSRPEQEKGHSLEGQENEARIYAKTHHYQIVRIFREIGSGLDLGRPVFQQLIKQATRGAFDVVVVWRRDRFCRHPIGTGFFESILKQSGVRVETVSQGPQHDTPETAFLNHIMDGVAGLEAAKIAERCQLGRTTAARHGEWPSRAPYGYLKDDNGHLHIHESQARLLRQAYQECIQGANRHRLGLILGVNPSTATRRLQNPAHKGEADYAGTLVPCPAIVTPTVWQTANDAISWRHQNGEPVASYERREFLRAGGCLDTACTHTKPHPLCLRRLPHLQT